jgi:hypothetical protein
LILRSICPQQPSWHNRFKSRKLSSPVWDVWIEARKTLALAIEVWSFVDPEGTGHAEPFTPLEVTLVVSAYRNISTIVRDY